MIIIFWEMIIIIVTAVETSNLTLKICFQLICKYGPELSYCRQIEPCDMNFDIFVIT
jgi:hypothetical protein